jgi:hypothetical protein
MYLKTYLLIASAPFWYSFAPLSCPVIYKQASTVYRYFFLGGGGILEIQYFSVNRFRYGTYYTKILAHPEKTREMASNSLIIAANSFCR